MQENQPFPEIALRFGTHRSPESVHLGAEGLDLRDISFDGGGKVRGVDAATCVLQPLQPLEAVSCSEQHFLGALVNLRQRPSS